MRLETVRGTGIRRLAPLLLMPAAAFAVHQLRYWLAFGSHAGAQLQVQGHSYLHSLAPWIVLMIAACAGAFLRALGRALGGDRSAARQTVSFTALWLLSAGSLVAIYAAQEFLEGLLTAGHPAGLIGIFAYGGWWSIPAALAVGLVLAAAFHAARWILDEVARRAPAHAPKAARASTLSLPEATLLPRLAPLAGGWSGRGPPG